MGDGFEWDGRSFMGSPEDMDKLKKKMREMQGGVSIRLKVKPASQLRGIRGSGFGIRDSGFGMRVLAFGHQERVGTRKQEGEGGGVCKGYRDTSLRRNSPTPGTYSRPMPNALRWP